MKDVGIVYGSAEQAKELIIGADTVYVHTDITQAEADKGETLFQYHEVQYTKDEYIKVISERNNELQQKVTDTQLALVEVYELMT